MASLSGDSHREGRACALDPCRIREQAQGGGTPLPGGEAAEQTSRQEVMAGWAAGRQHPRGDAHLVLPRARGDALEPTLVGPGRCPGLVCALPVGRTLRHQNSVIPPVSAVARMQWVNQVLTFPDHGSA